MAEVQRRTFTEREVHIAVAEKCVETCKHTKKLSDDLGGLACTECVTAALHAVAESFLMMACHAICGGCRRGIDPVMYNGKVCHFVMDIRQGIREYVPCTALPIRSMKLVLKKVEDGGNSKTPSATP